MEISLYSYKMGRVAADDRGKSNRIATPLGRYLIRQAPQLFEQLACNGNFLWEGVRVGYLFFEKRYPSLIRIPCTAQGTMCVTF